MRPRLPKPGAALIVEEWLKTHSPDGKARAFFASTRPDPRLLGANLLAATTGIRLGEVRGLLVQDVRGDSIHVCHNFQDREGLKGPKGSKGNSVQARDVPLPSATAQVLEGLIESNPWRDGFVFFGDTRGLPIGKAEIEDGHNQGCAAIGIDTATRKARGLGFHPWRHWYNSNLRGVVPDHALRALTAHRSAEMTDHYAEITAEQRAAVGGLAEGTSYKDYDDSLLKLTTESGRMDTHERVSPRYPNAKRVHVSLYCGLGSMKVQLHFDTLSQCKEFLSCTMDEEAYRTILQRRGDLEA